MGQEPRKDPGPVPLEVTAREGRVRARELVAVCQPVYQSGRAICVAITAPASPWLLTQMALC